jgi:hypothetical protein
MSPLAGRRPEDQLSVRRASVPSGNLFGPAPGVQTRGAARGRTVDAVCAGPYFARSTFTCPERVQAGATGRSWDVATRVKFPQEGAPVAVGQRAASSSILQALPTRPSRQSEMVGLEQVTARSTRPGRSVTQIPGECHGSFCPTERNAEAPCRGPQAEPGLHVSWAPSPLSAVMERALRVLHSSHWPQ